MSSLRRDIEPRLERLSTHFPVVAVLGARQVGKSTLLDRAFGQRAQVVVFDPVVDVANARQDPDLFLRLRGTPLILDEIQYAPELLPALKRAVDQRRGQPGQFFLTGSQQLPVLRGVQESLAGRVALLDLQPMSRRELHQATGPSLLLALLSAGPRTARQLYNDVAGLPRVASGAGLLRQLYRGGFPGLLRFGDDDVAEWMGSYLRTYVERDIRPLRDVGQPHDFTRFLRLMAALTGQELNASQLGRDIGIAPKTALAWLEVLELSFQLLRLPAWSGNTVKRVSGRPKLHLTDSGLASHLLSVSSPLALGGHPQLGNLFESYVVLEFYKQAQALATPPQFWHWRSTAGAEVDLVLERDGVLHPVEVKLTARPSRRDASGLRAFAQTYSHLRVGPGVVVHAGPDIELLDDQTVAVPVDWL